MSSGGKRHGSGRPDALERGIEMAKFRFMVDLSDRDPGVQLPVSMPCQERGCLEYGNLGIIMMVGRVWSIRPICQNHFNESQNIESEEQEVKQPNKPELQKPEFELTDSGSVRIPHMNTTLSPHTALNLAKFICEHHVEIQRILEEEWVQCGGCATPMLSKDVEKCPCWEKNKDRAIFL